MLLELKKVFQNDGESISVDYDLPMNDVEFYGVCPFKTPVKVRAQAKNRASLVDLKIIVDFIYTRQCDRCLKLLEKPMHYEFDHKLAVSLMSEIDEDYIETPDYKLELDEVVKTDIILELPAKFLCSEDCKGLCMKCGKNLNEGDCGCDKGSVDPRLEILKQLID